MVVRSEQSSDRTVSDLKFVEWFHQTSPYINQHRGKTFVLAFGGEVTESEQFEHIVHDIALLNGLGIRLIIVHGIRPQIEARLEQAGQQTEYHLGRRVTTMDLLPAVIDAAGASRVVIEAALSMGLANSPMSGAGIRVHSGNLITAKPLGVIDGVDYSHTGEVRKIDRLSIAQQLAYGNIVLISPLGYSLTGEVFNLCYEEVAAEVAVSIQADKLLFLSSKEGLELDNRVRREVVPSEMFASSVIQGHDERPQLNSTIAKENASISAILSAAGGACQRGVGRVHVLSYQRVGALLLELFTRDGVGTMISMERYETVRYACIDDVGGVVDLIRPLEEQGLLVRRSRERLEQEIQQFTVIVRDGVIVAAAALYPDEESGYGELACFVVSDQYRGQQKGEKLLTSIERRARGLGLKQLFVLTTRTAHWFVEHGFKQAAVEQLPVARQNTYNMQRRSKVFVKALI